MRRSLCLKPCAPPIPHRPFFIRSSILTILACPVPLPPLPPPLQYCGNWGYMLIGTACAGPCFILPLFIQGKVSAAWKAGRGGA